MAPRGGGEPTGALAEAISEKWGSYAQFKEAFSKSAVSNFGSGWTWLVAGRTASTSSTPTMLAIR